MISLLKLRVPEAEVIFFVKVLKCDIKDVCTDALGLSPLHPQCFASSAGAMLGAVLDPLQHCSGGRSSRGAAGAVFSDTLHYDMTRRLHSYDINVYYTNTQQNKTTLLQHYTETHPLPRPRCLP